MQFNSTTFIFFLVAVYFVYWTIARIDFARLWFLLVASCAFYMSWNAKIILLLLFTALIDYYVALGLARTKKIGWRRALVGVTLVSNLSVLAFFKYAEWFWENLDAVLRWAGWIQDPLPALSAAIGISTFWNSALTTGSGRILLPAGISFYTFQTLSYTIDVYRGTLAPSRSFTKFFLFITFFPQLVAGPIVRASEFLPQLEVPPRHDDRRALTGLLQVLKGLFKKVALADTIGELVVDPIFAAPEAFGSWGVVVGTTGAWFQYYLDFSAYSDIAIGAAAMFGFVLPMNFNRPFLSQSIGEFWRRWHMTLSSWFKDYIFMPLGGRSGGWLRSFSVLVGTLLLSGLWHGAGWNYLIFLGTMGVFIWIGSVCFRRRSPEERAARPLWLRFTHRAITFVLLDFLMIFFRNGTVAEGKHGLAGSMEMIRILFGYVPSTAQLSVIGLSTIGLAALIHFTPQDWYKRLELRWLSMPSYAQALVLVLFTGLLGALSYQQRPFVYFQF